MNCFYHPTVVAIGTCKSCNKGLCPSCAVDLGKGLACKGRCEEDVKNLIGLIDHNLTMIGTSQKMVSNARRIYFGNGVFYLAFGLLALIIGMVVSCTQDGLYGGLFVIVLASLFLIFGIFYVRRGFSIPAQKPPDSPSK
jgi:hypothetical protein